jgi:hypothetical protein
MAASRKMAYFGRLLREKSENLALHKSIITKREDDTVATSRVTSTPIDVNVTSVGINADTRHQNIAEVRERLTGNSDSVLIEL